MNEPREYKNSLFYILLVIIVIGIIIFTLLFTLLAVIGVEQTRFMILPFAGIFIVFSISLLYMAASKTIVSEDEISSKTMFGSATLKWSEIARVSGSGYAVKLHNFDGDVTVAISPRRPGYQEIIELIGTKRPDLFNTQEYSEFRRGLLKVLAQVIGGLSLIGVGALPFIIDDSSKEMIFTFIVVVVVGFIIIGTALLAPWSVSIQGKSIVIGYLFNRKTLTAAEIASIYFGYTQTRRGAKSYFLQISKRQGGTIRFTNLKPGLPIAYLVIKNWHKQNS